MKEVALVLKTAGKIAVVQIEKSPACSACKVCAFAGGKSRVKVRALNTAGAAAGILFAVFCLFVAFLIGRRRRKKVSARADGSGAGVRRI